MSLFSMLFLASWTSVRLSTARLMALVHVDGTGAKGIGWLGSSDVVQKSGDDGLRINARRAIFAC